MLSPSANDVTALKTNATTLTVQAELRIEMEENEMSHLRIDVALKLKDFDISSLLDLYINDFS